MKQGLENRKCPECGSPLKSIVYGLVDENHETDNILGGCEVDGTEPWLGCGRCDFRGFPGGRTFKTFHTKPGYRPGTGNSSNPEIIEREFNLLTASEDQLWGWSDGLYEARLELLHRGIPKERINAAYKENWELWTFMPFDPVEEIFVHYSRIQGRVLGVTMYFAHEKVQHALTLERAANLWRPFESSRDFMNTVLRFKVEGLETWLIESPHLETEDAYWGEECDLNSPFVKSLEASDWTSDPKAFPEEMVGLSVPILWPHWYDR